MDCILKQQNPLIVNLFGAPGAGKSTGAAYIFSKLKMHGVNAELVTEFAKDMVWENNATALKNQAYMFGQQSFRLSRCANQVDVVITDSPLMLSLLYNRDPVLSSGFSETVYSVFNSYDNMNYLLIRDKQYNPVGRMQTEEESDQILSSLRLLLSEYYIQHEERCGNRAGYDSIIADVMKELQHRFMRHI
ncbi:MAG: hypothetical protein IJO14_03495 [Clostridia bacterium]|nr:hypothetical protein [Clostridia bacterium]